MRAVLGLQSAKAMKKPRIYKSDDLWRVQFGKQNTTWFYWRDALDYVARRFRDTMSDSRWIERNASKFEGLWVALDGGRLIASGDSAKFVFEKAKSAGARVPFLHYISHDQYPCG